MEEHWLIEVAPGLQYGAWGVHLRGVPVSSMMIKYVSNKFTVGNLYFLHLPVRRSQRGQSVCPLLYDEEYTTHIEPASSACTALGGGMNIVEISSRASWAVLHTSRRVTTRRALLRNGHRAAWAHISGWAARTACGTSVGVVGSRGASCFSGLSSGGDIVARSRLKAASLPRF